MVATLTTSRDFNVQVLTETVRGAFARRNALVGNSPLASSGAVRVSPTMAAPRDTANAQWIGNTVTIPYFGTLGSFADNVEDNASVPSQLKKTNETATVARGSMSFEVSRWAQHSDTDDGDPYEEAARQLLVAAANYMDDKCITEAKGTPLVRDLYSASSPKYIDWDAVIDGAALWGDEGTDVAAMVVHSRVMAGLSKLRDDNGRPLLLENMIDGRLVRRFAGIPLHMSDRVPLDSSTMSSVTETGASVGNVGLTGTPTGPWNLQIDIVVGGARGTATFRFSTDGGNTWSATLTTAATVELTDTATDSLVGNNGTTGLTATFGVATYDAASVYSSNAILKATSLLFQRDAMAFWYAARHMEMLTDKDILKDNDVAAMHIYYAVKRYRRRQGGTKPGVVALKTNVPGFIS